MNSDKKIHIRTSKNVEFINQISAILASTASKIEYKTKTSNKNHYGQKHNNNCWYDDNYNSSGLYKYEPYYNVSGYSNNNDNLNCNNTGTIINGN